MLASTCLYSVPSSLVSNADFAVCSAAGVFQPSWSHRSSRRLLRPTWAGSWCIWVCCHFRLLQGDCAAVHDWQSVKCLPCSDVGVGSNCTKYWRCFLTEHLTPQLKRHPYRFSRLCTDVRRVSLYFTMGRPFSPKNLPLPMGDLDPHLIHGSPGPPKSSTQTAAQLVQPFLQGSLVWQTDRPLYSVGKNRPHLHT